MYLSGFGGGNGGWGGGGEGKWQLMQPILTGPGQCFLCDP